MTVKKNYGRQIRSDRQKLYVNDLPKALRGTFKTFLDDYGFLKLLAENELAISSEQQGNGTRIIILFENCTPSFALQLLVDIIYKFLGE